MEALEGPSPPHVELRHLTPTPALHAFGRGGGGAGKGCTRTASPPNQQKKKTLTRDHPELYNQTKKKEKKNGEGGGGGKGAPGFSSSHNNPSTRRRRSLRPTMLAVGPSGSTSCLGCKAGVGDIISPLRTPMTAFGPSCGSEKG